AQLCGSAGERIAIEDREVRELSGLERTDEVIEPEHIGGTEGGGLECLGDADPLIRTEDLPTRCGSLRGVGSGGEGIERGDGGVAVQRDRYAAAQSCGCRVHPLRDRKSTRLNSR